jgi:hypothetical protein
MRDTDPEVHLAQSLIVVAVGAVLAFAVTAEVGGIDLPTVGVILLVVGSGYFLFSILALFGAWPPDRR